MMSEASTMLSIVGLLLTGVAALFAWLLKSASDVGKAQVSLAVDQANLGRSVITVIARIDALVIKLESNFAIQINEQLLRNTLQEKARYLEERVNANVGAIERMQERLNIVERMIRFFPRGSRPSSAQPEPEET